MTMMFMTSIHLESTLVFLTLSFIILTILNYDIIIPTITIKQKKKKILIISNIIILSLFFIKLV